LCLFVILSVGEGSPSLTPPAASALLKHNLKKKTKITPPKKPRESTSRGPHPSRLDVTVKLRGGRLNLLNPQKFLIMQVFLDLGFALDWIVFTKLSWRYYYGGDPPSSREFSVCKWFGNAMFFLGVFGLVVLTQVPEEYLGKLMPTVGAMWLYSTAYTVYARNTFRPALRYIMLGMHLMMVLWAAGILMKQSA
jgi:hypothetical protein